LRILDLSKISKKEPHSVIIHGNFDIFLVFAKKYFGLKMSFFSLFGIQVIHAGILIGTVYFFLNGARSLLFYSKKWIKIL